MFQVPAVLTKVETLSDKSVRLKIDTQEVSSEDAAAIMLHSHKHGWCLFKDTAFAESEVHLPPVQIPTKGKKSNSQRLRNVLFLVWEKGQRAETFDDYYDGMMEKIINHYKESLAKLTDQESE